MFAALKKISAVVLAHIYDKLFHRMMVDEVKQFFGVLAERGVALEVDVESLGLLEICKPERFRRLLAIEWRLFRSAQTIEFDRPGGWRRLQVECELLSLVVFESEFCMIRVRSNAKRVKRRRSSDVTLTAIQDEQFVFCLRDNAPHSCHHLAYTQVANPHEPRAQRALGVGGGRDYAEIIAEPVERQWIDLDWLR